MTQQQIQNRIDFLTNRIEQLEFGIYHVDYLTNNFYHLFGDEKEYNTLITQKEQLTVLRDKDYKEIETLTKKLDSIDTIK
jgi:hypothetical protein